MIVPVSYGDLHAIVLVPSGVPWMACCWSEPGPATGCRRARPRVSSASLLVTRGRGR